MNKTYFYNVFSVAISNIKLLLSDLCIYSVNWFKFINTNRTMAKPKETISYPLQF